MYFVLAMCLFSGQGYEEVARLLTEGLAWARRWQGCWQVPTTAAISRARARLGPEPLRALFAQVCRPLATRARLGSFYRPWRLVAVDGTTFDRAGHRGERGFLRPAGFAARGERGRFPQVRVAALGECGTHAVFAAELGPLPVPRPCWPGSCLAACGRGCCCSPTAASPASTVAGRRRDRRGPAVAGQVHVVLPVRSSLPTAPTSATSTPPATSTGTPARPWSG